MSYSEEFTRFNAEVNVSVPYMLLPANTSRLKLDPAQVASLSNHLTEWNIRFPLYDSPLTHLPETVIDIQNLYGIFHPEIQGIKQQIKKSKSITLIGTDYEAIQIHQDVERRTHVPRPTITPGNEVLHRDPRKVKIFTLNPHAETEKKLPVDVEKVGHKLAVTSADIQPPPPESYSRIENVGSAIYDIEFQPNQAAMRGWLITCYINPTGEEGPWSDPVDFIIV
jgi:hypothetical protein